MENEVVSAVQAMKDSPFGLTGLKIEFEAVFFRESCSDVCLSEDCHDGELCEKCEGDTNFRCPDCDGDEEIRCADCRGTGQRRRLADRIMVNHGLCNGTGRLSCPNLLCDEGRVDCDVCDDGHMRCNNHLRVRDMQSFNDYVLSKLVPLGLAEASENGYCPNGHWLARHFKPIGALAFSKFYVDMSVDTEWTMTLKVDDPRVVLKLPEIIGVFTSIGTLLGRGTSSRGAGLHIALLNSPNAYYPTSNGQLNYFNNFKKSMSLLMPAIFFMGSSTEKSRPLRYRVPVVRTSDNGKYNAINYTGGALEFRVFETCYERPEAIYEYLITMANCMRFWTARFTPTGLRKIITRCKFGSDENESLERFFKKEKHVKLLNAGLLLLKPKSMTVTQLKELRKFTVTEATIKRKSSEYVEDIERQYAEYAHRQSLIPRAYKANFRVIDKTEFMRHKTDELNRILSYEGDIALAEPAETEA
jgi:predicted RNA-binding Zn-ribbon protein involved in translation (DUF1610 family)